MNNAVFIGSCRVKPATRENILVVEDDQGVLDLVASILRANTYVVYGAGCARDALTICKYHPEPIDLLLTDLKLPDLNGLELARRAAALRPGIRCLFMSGYPVDPALVPMDRFLEKPFCMDNLLRAVAAALAPGDDREPVGSGPNDKGDSTGCLPSTN